MGYTHYWYRPKAIDKQTFAFIVRDFSAILPELAKLGIKLGDGFGEGSPLVSASGVIFNGLVACGHPANEAITIPWPTDNASGIGSSFRAESGNWFAGTQISARCCDGDCSYESFSFERTFHASAGETPYPEGWFSCTKTAFRPYDLAVTAFLVIAKHHMGDSLKVSTDGTDANWLDAKRLCYVHLGFGLEFQVNSDGELALAVKPAQQMEAAIFTAEDHIAAHGMGIRL